MSNNSNRTPTKIKFSIQELNGKAIVKMENETEGMQSSKTIQLKTFIDFITEYNKDKVVNDSGFLPPNLVRKVTRGSREICLYFFPELLVSPSFYSDKTDIQYVLNHCKDNLKAGCGIKIETLEHTSGYDSNDSEDDDDDECRTDYTFKDLLITNVVLATTYDSNSHYTAYNVFHALKEDSIFDTSSGPYEAINENTKLISSIFPNHYDNSICWGNINFTSGLSQDFKDRKYSAIRNIPFNYFNSVFNNDLLGSGHERDNNSDTDYRSVTPELRKNVLDFYMTNSEFPSSSLSTFKDYFNNRVLLESSTRLSRNIGALLFFTAPILSDSVMYDQYFKHIANSKNSRTVAQYLAGTTSQ